MSFNLSLICCDELWRWMVRVTTVPAGWRNAGSAQYQLYWSGRLSIERMWSPTLIRALLAGLRG